MFTLWKRTQDHGEGAWLTTETCWLVLNFPLSHRNEVLASLLVCLVFLFSILTKKKKMWAAHSLRTNRTVTLVSQFTGLIFLLLTVLSCSWQSQFGFSLGPWDDKLGCQPCIDPLRGAHGLILSLQAVLRNWEFWGSREKVKQYGCASECGPASPWGWDGPLWVF